MLSKIFIAGLVVASGAMCSQRLVGAGNAFRLKMGMSARWTHMDATLRTKSQAKWNAGYAVAPQGFAISSAPLDDRGIPVGDYHRNIGDLIGIGFTRLTLTESNGDCHVDGNAYNNGAAADQALDPIIRRAQAAVHKFLRTLEFGDVSQYYHIGGAPWDQGVGSAPFTIDNNIQQALWLFGYENELLPPPDADGRQPKVGALVPYADRTISGEHEQKMNLSRPAVDLTAELSFELNPMLALYAQGGYGFVFGDDQVEKNISYVAKPGADEQYADLLQPEEPVIAPGGLSYLTFDTTKGVIMRGVEAATSIKEGWRGFVGFNYMPSQNFFVSAGVGLKQYAVKSVMKGGELLYPISPFIRSKVYSSLATNPYVVKMLSTVTFAKDIYSLAFQFKMGLQMPSTRMNGGHYFAIGLEYASAKADLDVSAKKAGDKGEENKRSGKSAQLIQEFAEPFDAVGAMDEGLMADEKLSSHATLHFSAIKNLTVIRTASLDLKDIAISLEYKFSL